MKGDVLIHIEGLLLEKLIQRALSEGAHFISILRTDDHSMEVEAAHADGEILLELCRRYSISAKVLCRRGKPIVLDRLRRRWTALIGIALCVSLCWLFLSRIWVIDVHFTGAQASSGNAAEIRHQLDDMDIFPGISNMLDTSLLSGKLEAALSGYSYVSAKSQGIRLLIEAAPEVPEPEIYDLSYARDLYADTDGIVVSINIHSGIACVQPGDIIRRGQLLIRGEERITSDEVRSIGALGEVMVRTWYEGTASGSLHETRAKPTGRTSSSTWLDFMGYTLPIITGETFRQFDVQQKHLAVGGIFLPVEIVVENRIETTDAIFETDVESLSDRLCTLAMADAAAHLALFGPDEYEIIRSWINYDTPGDGVLTARAVYEIYTDAAVTRGALLQGG